ncbi:UNVERIFIED_CONTAM: putative mitochondrial protein [Sesamum calycinum]|uniref:Mitochondrial protein n=1 Tax=Sesamum calycinum TaxID=2727403 RepID=A0AAW2SWJ4_9LAMI
MNRDFGKEIVEYLGHIISKEEISTNPCKIEYMKNWPPQKTVKELRGFIGLTGYYAKFIKSYWVISKPLTELLNKDNFEWTSLATNAFDCLKQAMTAALVLALLDFTKSFVIGANTCHKGVGPLTVDPYIPTTQPEVGEYLRERAYPAKIPFRRLIFHRNIVVPHIRVQWENYSEAEVTWEDYYGIVSKFPEFVINPQGRGQTYQRAMSRSYLEKDDEILTVHL